MTKQQRQSTVASQPVDAGLLGFDRNTGRNILLRSPRTDGLRRSAPRVLQVGLLTPCNLSCSFCYRDVHAPSRLTSDFLGDLLRKAADWGVLEVAFGGGEPLLFRGFVTLLEQLRAETVLGLNFTTNGTLLDQTTIELLRDHVDEIRLSAYADNDYRATLRRLCRMNVGINWLVTPANVHFLEPFIYDCFRLGARNVLLLGYKGIDNSLHLSEPDRDQLRHAVLRLQHLPLRLDICWYPLLPELPHLFARTDCGAGDEFLVITPDRAVQPCSFHHQRIPFETFEDLKRIYDELRDEKPNAKIPGCTRQLFQPQIPRERPTGSAVWVWEARSANNSGAWTIVGTFRKTEDAEQAAQALRELARAHEAFLASPEGAKWLEDNEYFGCVPTPPLRAFGKAHGFDWTGKDEGLWWEEDGAGAPVLTAGRVGTSVVVYHPYCMGLPEGPFRSFFERVGATAFGYLQYDQPLVVAHARGSNPAAIEALRVYLRLVEGADYPSDVKVPPPWGQECHDPRVANDEDRSAELAKSEHFLQQQGDHLRVGLTFQNTFSGAIALSNWLERSGFEQIQLRLEADLDALRGKQKTAPMTGFLGDVRPIEKRVAAASPADIVDLVLNYESSMPDDLRSAYLGIPVEERLRLTRSKWEQSTRVGDRDYRALWLIELIGPAAAEWLRTIAQRVIAEQKQYMGFLIRIMVQVLPKDEAFDRALECLRAARDRRNQVEILDWFTHLKNPRTLELIEEWWQAAAPDEPITTNWAPLAAASGLSWTMARKWIESGRPLSLIALEALVQHRDEPPAMYQPPRLEDFMAVLQAYGKKDPTPRATKAIRQLIDQPGKLVRQTRS